MTVARGEESPERLGGALRRLHYRATRRAHSAAARHHATTPKVTNPHALEPIKLFQIFKFSQSFIKIKPGSI
ncbi:unnamed protein product [Colias eurytheme]|nr:unnamed protein product [Colias eurytheme]